VATREKEQERTVPTEKDPRSEAVSAEADELLDEIDDLLDEVEGETEVQEAPEVQTNPDSLCACGTPSICPRVAAAKFGGWSGAVI
jgi:hypothetical protein